MIFDIILVREGRDEVKVRGNARAVSLTRALLQPRVTRGMECKKCLKRKRARAEEEEVGGETSAETTELRGHS
jgi:hypothetical protein